MLAGSTEQGVQLINKEEVLDHLVDPRSLLSAGTLEQRKAFLASFLRRVSRNGDEVEIECLLPLPPEAAHLPSDEVLPTYRHGGPGQIRTDGLRINGTMLGIAWGA